jgi:hypothetical protein
MELTETCSSLLLTLKLSVDVLTTAVTMWNKFKGIHEWSTCKAVFWFKVPCSLNGESEKDTKICQDSR